LIAIGRSLKQIKGTGNRQYRFVVHRILNGAKLPIWVSHSVKKDEVDGNLVRCNPDLNDQRVLV
jgi:hypothetical protein